jgi:hypothetical protein
VKTLLILGLISILLIAGCTQSNLIESSQVILTQSDVESVGIYVADVRSTNAITRDDIIKLPYGNVSESEKIAGYPLPVSGDIIQFNILQNDSVRVLNTVNVFDTDGDAKDYYNYIIQYRKNDTKNYTIMTNFNFGDERSAACSNSGCDLEFRKGKVVVQIVVFSNVDAEVILMKLASITENKLE